MAEGQDSGEATRIALASFVDRDSISGFGVLVTSLLVHNPWIDHDFVVLFDGLDTLDLQRISALYPRFVFHGSEENEVGRRDARTRAARDVLRESSYDRLVILDAAAVVLGDIGDLLAAALPTPRDGLLGAAMTCIDRQPEDVDSSTGAPRGADTGAAAPEVDPHACVDVSSLPLDVALPPTALVARFDGPLKPWRGGEIGRAAVEARWHEWNLHPVQLWRRFLEAADPSSPIAEVFERWAAPFAAVSTDDFSDLREAARRYRSAGDFGAAFAALRAARLGAMPMSPGALRELGVAAMAVSRPDIARLALTEATVDDVVAPLALVARAELEWTYRDYEAAEAAAIDAIRYHPTLGKAHALLTRIERSRREDGTIERGDGPRIGHVAFYVDHEGNFGDVMLPVAVRASIEDAVPDARWSSIHAHQVFDVDRARWANENLDAIVIGGGGLFLPDTSPNGNSGWQWNVTDEALRELRIPIVVYTVGYNLFPGQSFHGDRFAESARLLVEKAAFVGLRNHGSVTAVRGVVGEALADKVEFLPCVTTVFGGLTGRGPTADEGRPVVLLNIAFDRKASRFGDGYGAFVAAIADLAARLRDFADLRCLAHTKEDERIVHDVRERHGISIPVDPVYGLSWERALDLIGRADVVVGMRGHAAMIPFGIGVPILSIISHAKLRYFLEDIGHEDWGVDAGAPDLAEVLDLHIRRILADREGTAATLAEAQQRLRGVVDEANARIAQIIRGA